MSPPLTSLVATPYGDKATRQNQQGRRRTHASRFLAAPPKMKNERNGALQGQGVKKKAMGTLLHIRMPPPHPRGVQSDTSISVSTRCHHIIFSRRNAHEGNHGCVDLYTSKHHLHPSPSPFHFHNATPKKPKFIPACRKQRAFGSTYLCGVFRGGYFLSGRSLSSGFFFRHPDDSISEINWRSLNATAAPAPFSGDATECD